MLHASTWGFGLVFMLGDPGIIWGSFVAKGSSGVKWPIVAQVPLGSAVEIHGIVPRGRNIGRSMMHAHLFIHKDRVPLLGWLVRETTKQTNPFEGRTAFPAEETRRRKRLPMTIVSCWPSAAKKGWSVCPLCCAKILQKMNPSLRGGRSIFHKTVGKTTTPGRSST